MISFPIYRYTKNNLCSTHFSGQCCCKHNIINIHDINDLSPVPEYSHFSDLLIGCHIRMSDNLSNILKIVKKNGMKTCQVFLDNQYHVNKIDIEYINTYLSDVKFHVHAPLTCNLGRPVGDRIAINTRNVLAKELSYMTKMTGSLIVHIGAIGNYNDVAENLRELYVKGCDMRKLVLENSSGAGTQIGSSIEELRKLFEAIDFSQHLGLCLDTQHSFASGMSSFSSYESTIKLFEEIDSVIGKDGMKIIHLNDSKTDYLSKKDRHENISQGSMWYKNDDSLVALFDIGRERDINFILETPDPIQDRENIINKYI